MEVITIAILTKPADSNLILYFDYIFTVHSNFYEDINDTNMSYITQEKRQDSAHTPLRPIFSLSYISANMFKIPGRLFLKN